MLKTIIWDFNGTLVDDAPLVLALNNRVFPRYGAKPFKDMAHYLKAFRFPIREYYRDIGVKDELFDAAAMAWSAGYKELAPSFPLRQGVLEAVAAFQRAGLNQVVISASELAFLNIQLSYYPELTGVFSAVLGLDNIYATSKTHLAIGYMAQNGLSPSEAILIGDTLHDAEVAGGTGCQCILVKGGHQSEQTLLTAGVPVLESLYEVARYVQDHLK